MLLLLRAADSVDPPEYTPAESNRTPNDITEKREKQTERVAAANEFSDHSDGENDFGRLPESVFHAIEDVRSSDENDSPERPTNADLPANKTGVKVSRVCPACGKRCTSVSGWYYHVRSAHAAGGRLACHCGKTFPSAARLAAHTRTHSGERPFSCRVCGAGFASAAGRYIHERTHTERREHACARCGRAFRWRAQLARHEARHERRRAHVCAQCGRGFSVSGDLARHARAHRPGAHACALCGATFKQPRYLKVHLANVHSLSPGQTPPAPLDPHTRGLDETPSSEPSVPAPLLSVADDQSKPDEG